MRPSPLWSKEGKSSTNSIRPWRNTPRIERGVHPLPLATGPDRVRSLPTVAARRAGIVSGGGLRHPEGRSVLKARKRQLGARGHWVDPIVISAEQAVVTLTTADDRTRVHAPATDW